MMIIVSYGSTNDADRVVNGPVIVKDIEVVNKLPDNVVGKDMEAVVVTTLKVLGTDILIVVEETVVVVAAVVVGDILVVGGAVVAAAVVVVVVAALVVVVTKSVVAVVLSSVEVSSLLPTVIVT
jgi:hypothetical protein